MATDVSETRCPSPMLPHSPLASPRVARLHSHAPHYQYDKVHAKRDCLEDDTRQGDLNALPTDMHCQL